VRLAQSAGDDAARALERAAEAAVSEAASRAAAEATASILAAVSEVSNSLTEDLVKGAVGAITSRLPPESALAERIDAGVRNAAQQAAAVVADQVAAVANHLAAARKSTDTLAARFAAAQGSIDKGSAAAEAARVDGAAAREAAEAAGREAAEAGVAVRALVDADRAVVLDEEVLTKIVAAATAALAERIESPGGAVVTNLRPAVQVAVDAALASRVDDAVDHAFARRLTGAIDEVMGPRVEATVEASRLATVEEARRVAKEISAPNGLDEISATVAQAVAHALDGVRADLDALDARVRSLTDVLLTPGRRRR